MLCGYLFSALSERASEACGSSRVETCVGIAVVDKLCLVFVDIEAIVLFVFSQG